ncbi:MAG: ABC transporter ATP-binding protein [Pseudomonadota bacterium]|nr:ABC transporter ATP-binding protein [Pseudomonadota bacterium]
MNAVKFENVGLILENGVALFRGLSFALEQGSLNFVTGASGCGKTTLLQLMGGDFPSWTGRIQVFETEILPGFREELARPRSRVGIVFQEPRLLDHLTARENLTVPLLIGGAAGKELEEPVSELLEWLGTDIKGAKSVASLSTGEKRLLAIARALVCRPALVLADEPTASLDAKQKASVLRFFTELCALGTAVVIATTDDWLISQYVCSSQLFIENGRLQQIEGTGLLSSTVHSDIGVQ